MRNLNNESGQTSVEYILLIMVVASLLFSLFQPLKQFMLGTGNCGPGDTSIMCSFKNSFSSGDLRYFTLKR